MASASVTITQPAVVVTVADDQLSAAVVLADSPVIVESTGPAGPGVPTGGATGQVLAKSSGADYDTGWSDAGSVTSVNGETGAVSLDAADVGAVDKTGDTMTGQLLVDETAWPVGLDERHAALLVVDSGGQPTVLATHDPTTERGCMIGAVPVYGVDYFVLTGSYVDGHLLGTTGLVIGPDPLDATVTRVAPFESLLAVSKMAGSTITATAPDDGALVYDADSAHLLLRQASEWVAVTTGMIDGGTP